MQELPFLHSARRLMLIDICMKFCEDSFRGFQVTERTRFVTDRQTDRQADRWTPGEKQYVSQTFGGGGGGGGEGDIIIKQISKVKKCRLLLLITNYPFD